MSFRRRICGGVTFPREGPLVSPKSMYSTRDRTGSDGRTETVKLL